MWFSIVIRILFGVIVLAGAIAAGGIGWFAFAVHGLVEDAGSEPANTLPFAIPWTIGTVALFACLVGVITGGRHRDSFLVCGVLLTVLMTTVLYGVTGNI
jgi:hypothetical protein